MDTQPTNSTGSPSDSDPDDPPTNPPPDDSSSPDPANQSPPQDLLDDPPPSPPPPSPPSQDSSQNSPAPPINTQPINSSPARPSSGSENSLPSPPSVDLSRSQPPTLSPPGGQLTSNPPTLPPPSPSPTSPVVPETPTISGSSNVLQKSDSNTGQIRSIGLVAIGLVFGFVFLGIIGVAVWCIWRRMKKVSAEAGLPTSLGASPHSDYGLKKMLASPAKAVVESGHESANGSTGLGNSRNWLSYEELVRATNEFSESNLLGEGGFGSVFKGCLKDGREVAVKQLKDGGGQGEREFRAEVETISRIHHRHLVSLVGYCISDDKRLLVYDYVPNNTLHFHLHGQSEHILDWPTRIKIATGAARGIAYLHVDCHPRIVHRDIKSSNILLDNNFEAQVSDFGLARWFSDLNTHVTTRVMGTFGYMAPEYALSGKLTEKSDVFSFGVVLLELVTGRKPVDSSQPPGEESLVEWAQPLLNDALDKEEFKKLVDPRLENNYVVSEMFRVIEAAAACVQFSALKRPKMSQILRAFVDMSVSDGTNMMRVGENEIVDAAQKSAEISLFRRMAFGSQDYSTSSFSQGDFKSEEI